MGFLVLILDTRILGFLDELSKVEQLELLLFPGELAADHIKDELKECNNYLHHLAAGLDFLRHSEDLPCQHLHSSL